jgi:hypothetical protein
LRLLRFARRTLERLGRRMQIAGAVIDDGDAHRDAPGSGNSPMTTSCGVLRLRSTRGQWRRRSRPALAACRRIPALEEALLGGFFRIRHDDAELTPLAARQLPAPQRTASSPISSAITESPESDRRIRSRSRHRDFSDMISAI